MKFYKHWAKASEEINADATSWKIQRYGWSNLSAESALAKARELAQQTVAAVRSGQPLGKYLYSDRPVREQIVQELGDGQTTSAVITRNAYGSLVLNTADAFFADIDDSYRATLPQPLKVLFGFIDRFLGRTSLSEIESTETPPAELVQRVVEGSPGMGARLYRTAAGYRCLITSHTFDPCSEETSRLLAEFGSDPLYHKLCQVQESFRARLTPKFWRCDAYRPPARFPWDGPIQEQEMLSWERDYNERARHYSTCRLIGTFGSDEVHPQIEPLIKLHDGITCREGLPLA